MMKKFIIILVTCLKRRIAWEKQKRLSSILKEESESPDLHNGLGIFLWVQDKQAVAEKEFQKTMELSLGYGLEIHNQAKDK